MTRLPLVAAALLVALPVALPAGAADRPRTEPDPLTRHARSVATVVFNQVAEAISRDDRERRALLEQLLGQRAYGRYDLHGRAIQPVGRREAIVRALDKNLTLAIARGNPEKAKELLREAGALFDPTFEVQIGYNRQDTYRRTRFGTVRPKIFVPQGNEFVGVAAGLDAANGPPWSAPLPSDITQDDIYCQLRCRMNLTRNAPQRELGDRAQVVAYEFYENTSDTPIDTDIVTSDGREFGHPKQQINYTLGVTQLLPWGGTLTLTDRTVQQRIYYRENYYWEDGQFTTNITAALDTPLPYTKDFGRDGTTNTQIKQALIQRDRAEWELKSVLNQVLLDTDTAFFNVVRSLGSLQATVRIRDSVRRLNERMDRLYASGLGTRYQKSQLDAELAKADVQVERALEAYIGASIRLAGLIGDPDNLRGQAIFLPVGYADDIGRSFTTSLERAVAAAKVNRPELFMEELNRQSAQVALDYARNQARPDLRASGSLGLSENGTVYGYSDPLQSHMGVFNPDTTSRNMGLTYTYPWGNRAAEARLGQAEVSRESAELKTRETANQVRREIAQRLAQLQSARAALKLRTDEARDLRSAFASIERQLAVGLVSEDEIVNTLRRLLAAETGLINAQADAETAESGVLWAQGTIAAELPMQTAEEKLDQRRIKLLAEGGHLRYFGAAAAQTAEASARK